MTRQLTEQYLWLHRPGVNAMPHRSQEAPHQCRGGDFGARLAPAPRALVVPIPSITYDFGLTKEFAEVAAGVLTPRLRKNPQRTPSMARPTRELAY